MYGIGQNEGQFLRQRREVLPASNQTHIPNQENRKQYFETIICENINKHEANHFAGVILSQREINNVTQYSRQSLQFRRP